MASLAVRRLVRGLEYRAGGDGVRRVPREEDAAEDVTEGTVTGESNRQQALLVTHPAQPLPELAVVVRVRFRDLPQLPRLARRLHGSLHVTNAQKSAVLCERSRYPTIVKYPLVTMNEDHNEDHDEKD